ncbi:helix-turn-helix transcriptional regulator [Haloplanus litoreus]|uniref:Helix-turn-helix transcriptional regulator n=1 Tax=Haloplanus litoreus TaxID=767515 RepID=A0ABD5ZU01_9EURY
MSDTALEYLLGSATRPETLTALREGGYLSARQLEERVSASRRTLKRTLRTMESRGWVRSVDGGYELTAMGATMLSSYDCFRRRERLAEEARPFLERTPASAFDLDVEALADATVVRPDTDPTAPVDRLLELRADATRIREVAPFLLNDTVEQLATRVEHDPTLQEVTLVLEEATPHPSEFSPTYCDRFRAVVDSPRTDVYVAAADVPFAFGVADGHAFLGSSGVDDMAGALLESDDEAVVDWVDRSIDRCLDHADPLS